MQRISEVVVNLYGCATKAFAEVSFDLSFDLALGSEARARREALDREALDR